MNKINCIVARYPVAEGKNLRKLLGMMAKYIKLNIACISQDVPTLCYLNLIWEIKREKRRVNNNISVFNEPRAKHAA